MPSDKTNGQGLWLSGKFLSVEDGRSFQKADGTTVTPAVIAVLVGSTSFKVEVQRGMQEALAILGGAEPEPMDDVMVPVYAQGPWDREAGRRGRVFYAGRLASA